MESVFNNSLIMDIISSQLTMSDIKNLRQVNPSLNQMMLQYLKKQNFTLVIPTSSSEFNEIQQIDQSTLELDSILVKNVKLNIGSSVLKKKNNKKNQAQSTSSPEMTSIIEFFKIHQASIENLHIFASSRFAPVLTQILMTFQFPSLTHFSITEGGDLRSSSRHVSTLGTNLEQQISSSQQFQKLISIRFQVDRDSLYRDRYSRQGPAFCHLIQDLMDEVNVSKNLQELEIKDDFVPDFSDCTSLKKLRIKIEISSTKLLNSKFNMLVLNRMLNQVKNTLEELSLDAESEVSSTYRLCLPSCLPNLKILKISNSRLLNFWWRRNVFNPQYYPKLETLVFGVYYIYQASYLEPSNIPVPTLKELEFVGISNLYLIRKAMFLFPNVKSLTLQPFIPYPYDFFAYFNQLLGSVWKLENLTLTGKSCTFRLFFDWIEYISMEGLKTLKLSSDIEWVSPSIFLDGIDDKYQLSTGVRSSLLKTATLEKFIIQVQSMPNYVEKALAEYATEHQLPLHIICIK